VAALPSNLWKPVFAQQPAYEPSAEVPQWVRDEKEKRRHSRP
jgi:hypothetical protein